MILLSRRTAEANKAISEAWKKEQKLVQKGEGTRDWTLKQQQDILEKGKAYDEDGFAFQGQHMKSVEKYPKFQGDPGNIQFLTRREHLEAHNGSWNNSTNWYYNPNTKEKIDFGEGDFIPCKIIKLSESAVNPPCKKVHKEEAHRKIVDKSSRKVHQKKKRKKKNQSELKESFFENVKILASDSLYKGIMLAIENADLMRKVHRAFKISGEIYKEGSPVIEEVVAVITRASIERDDSKSDVTTDLDYRKYEGYFTEGENIETKNHPSPNEHTVKGHGQYYHTKEGKKWVEKEPYSRGGKKED